MKALVCLIIISISLCLPASAQSQFSSVITRIENSLFGVDYSNQSDAIRLNRIEESVYGQTSNSNVASRVQKLSQDLSADVIGKEIKPKSDTFSDEESQYAENIPKEDSSVDYPVVNNLENQVFKQVYKSMDIKARLSKLEQKTFNRAYENDDLSTRVDRLKTAVLPKAEKQDDLAYKFDEDTDDILGFNSSTKKKPNYYTYEDSDNSTPYYNQNNSVLDDYPSTSDIQVPLSALEKSMLKKTYPDDPVPNRLSRLEAQMFSSNFIQDEPEVRMQRLSSAYQAKKSSQKYDGNKFSKHASTAIQIGAILLMVLAMVL